MASGIRATVSFDAPVGCPVARVSAAARGVVDQVSTSASLPGGEGSVTEFLADTGAANGVADATPVFSYGREDLVRTPHNTTDPDCPCEVLGAFGCPVHRYVADDGDLTLVFHAEDMTHLQAVMDALLAVDPDLDVRQLLQPPLEGEPDEQVFVNRGKLTDRQLEILETAYREGYFERPKRANASELAASLGISQSTFTEHLMAAQRKLLDDLLERPS